MTRCDGIGEVSVQSRRIDLWGECDDSVRDVPRSATLCTGSGQRVQEALLAPHADAGPLAKTGRRGRVVNLPGMLCCGRPPGPGWAWPPRAADAEPMMVVVRSTASR